MTRFFFFITILIVGLSAKTLAQTTTRPNAFQFQYLWTDYNSLDPIYRGSNEGRFLYPNDINYAAGIGYQRAINASFNVGAVLRLGSIDAHHEVFEPSDTSCQPCQRRLRNELFVSGDLIGQYKFANGYLLPENFVLRPYLFVGLGLVHMSLREISTDLQLPMGLGFNVHVSPQFALQLQAEYRKSLLVNKDNLALGVGLVVLMNAAQ
jgi:hypothetical protein